MQLRLVINGKNLMNTNQVAFRNNERIWYDKHRLCSIKHTEDDHCTISVQDLHGDDDPNREGGDL